MRTVRFGLAILAGLALNAADAMAQAPQTRMSWQAFVSGPDGAKRLASLTAAVQKMKSLDSSPQNSADFRRSWQYWANIHGYYGPKSPDGTVAQQTTYLTQNGMSQYVPYYQGVNDQTPPDAIAAAIWATCQHSASGQQANFFGWHRMYLYYFERVLRWAANDNTLRLPYWDYTDPIQLALPAAFRSASSVLYDAKRNARINAGTSTLNQKNTNVNLALKETNYLKYELQIEQHIHGYVHCTVGPTCPVAHMGDVPVAANDPVFYDHHANIDRLWACWQHSHTAPPAAWMDQKFSFVDETGTLQTRPVKDFLDSSKLGYVYDNTANCARPTTALVASAAPAAPPPGLSAMMAPAPTVLAAMQSVHTTPAVNVDTASTTVKLSLPQPQVAAALSAAKATGTVHLILHDITAGSHPGAMLDVFLAKASDPSDRRLVGTISWFGAFNHRHHGAAAPEKRTETFDVTEELQSLGATATSPLTMVIEASDGRETADVTAKAASKEEAKKLFRAASKVRIGSIELQAETQAAPKK